MMRTTQILMLLCVLGTRGFAQDLTIKAPAQDKPMTIIGGTVHTVSHGVIEDATVVVERGEIVFVGEMDAAREFVKSMDETGEWVVIDAAGRHVYPGLIGANTVMGLIEIGAVRATRDMAELGSITPEVRAAVSVNPDSTVIPVTRLNGVLTCGVFPTGGAIPGQAGVIRMDGWTWEDLAIEQSAGVIVNWPNMRTGGNWWDTKSHKEQRESVAKNIRAIDEAFDAADAYLLAKDADEHLATDLRWEALRGALREGGRVFVRAQELDQIEAAARWGARRGFDVVILGGRDAPKCAELLAELGVGVIYSGTHRSPKRRDSAYDAVYAGPIALDEAGVGWCMATTGGSFQTPHERNLPYHAASAVRHGLSEARAIRAITLGAAEMLGVDDRLGSIEVGKLATLIITDGSPLEVTTAVEMALIDGRVIDLSSKQTKLSEKYREKYRQIGAIED
jgi:imidazolonepropionase-like amidohydrolase